MKLYSIQYLRGMAAILILIAHNSFLLGGSISKIIPGALGVDIFFIISGFIIAFITSQHYEPPITFAIKRVFRIWPCLFVVWLLSTLIVYKWDNADKTVCALYFCLQNFNSPGPSFGYSPLGPPWTLTYEITFYIIFMLSMIISYRHRVSICILIILSLMTSLQMFFNESFAWSSQASLRTISFSWWGGILKILSNTIFIEFIIGMLLHEVLKKIHTFKSLPVSRVFLFIFAISSISSFVVGPQVFGVEGGMTLAVLIVTSLVISEYLSEYCNFKPLSFLGDVSYSIYLVHFPVMMFITDKHGFLFNTLPHSVLFITSIIISILLAYLLNFLIEKPSIKLARSLVGFIADRITLKKMPEC
ncbi:Peptidoglycan/LPS O-acetylase OafA/YrhL, contains acyltransferase and SGNH-hydrolase domains [Rosenbergiella nectarea]|uniref:Peptidoglycan/LPS O-acetylase OafA/YrhL, contains acyltransferase and SGNH-hydrolase domains n=1 Tax=Rosenbergiella nectarea TaxID=988801 RepID=A0A1H9GKB2_9GAMM|nr:acyltransferase [Rosenbergiella nectarea]SEQ50541.1 Peptidoglycan/LPS O-acetylase OafA/YrhL, contains acyltransferase and SGNH-hydrolase domains [Rosenbergiella nectarea]